MSAELEGADVPPLSSLRPAPAPSRVRSHLSIGEVLALLQHDYPDITISKIRFLESQGLLNPERTPSGYRKFYDQDVEQLRWVLRQQKENFLPLKVIKDRLAAGRLDAPASDSGLLDLNAGVGPVASDEPDSPGDPAHVRPAVAVVAPLLRRDLTTGPNTDTPDAATDSGHNHDRIGSAPDSDDAQAGAAANPASTANPENPGNPANPANPANSARPAAVDEPRSMDLGVAMSSVSMTGRELCAASGLTPRQLAELEQYGLVTARTLGHDGVYDEDALVVANLAAAMGAFGLNPRHLRMFKVAAEREAGMYEQMALPRMRTNRPEVRRQAVDDVARVAGLAEQLHRALLRDALKNTLGPR